ncbi:TlpA family protein disulfide reductase [Cochleicola gelatinilyticus]|uniref:Thioredoxin domain-containing protein n=1 Tax=Cochleicola gelatinilyticus TaxID=1763537 RepID=A0A167J913_9FLAO|nr:TlpA disulfide reductase family protein [Cochleicola gelatinilyticus]OAB80440.1 hypothetical protein ULVI_06805 [Cochleicola gelatinilyticus]
MNFNTFLKQTIFIGIFLVASFVQAQDVTIKKPEYVLIANNTIITKEELTSYGEKGLIKAMNKGVSEEKRTELAATFGPKIGEKEFIIIIDLFTTEEAKQRKNNTTITSKIVRPKRKGDGFLLRAGDRAADFTVQMVDGTQIQLSDLKGKVVLLNFWATWCAPCIKEFYDMPEAILSPFKEEAFVFLPVSMGEPLEKVSKKITDLQKKGLNFNAGIDPKKEIWNQYATYGIPRNFVIDKDGIVRYVSSGYSEENITALAKEIRALLEIE